MPRVYKRKVDAKPYAQYSTETLNAAIAAVNDGKTIRLAAKEFKIPYATWHRKVNGRS